MNYPRFLDVISSFLKATKLTGPEQEAWLAELRIRDREICREVVDLIEALPDGSAPGTGQPEPAVLGLEAFQEQHSQDRDAGRNRELHEYLALFPGNDDAIAIEYLALKHGSPSRAIEPANTFSAGAPGERLGNYEIVREIGHGGQGIVYEARDQRLGRRVAIKILTSRAARSEAARARFRREAAVMARLDDTGICPVHEAGFEGEVPFIVMRLVEGRSLAQLIPTLRENAPTDPSPQISLDGEGPAVRNDTSPEAGSAARVFDTLQAVEIIEHAARSLHVAHEAGVIHRDIKPGNIMVGADGRPVLMDFGLARAEDPDLETLTLEGDLFGTPDYMSPEQLSRQDVRLDRRTDIWSLGVCLYEALTARRPFRAPTREGTYQAILSTEPIDARKLNPAISQDLAIVIATALQKDRERRYQTALDLTEDLRRVREHEPILARPASAWTLAVRWVERHPGVAASFGLAFAILMVGIIVALVLKAQSDANAAAKGVALNEWERLADGRRVDDLLREADERLWPAVPENALAMEEWFAKARQQVAGLDDHRTALNQLRQRAKPYSGEMVKADRAEQEKKLGVQIAVLRSKEEAARKSADQAAERLTGIGPEMKALAAKEFPSPRDELRKEQLEDQIEYLTERRSDLEKQVAALASERAALESHLGDRLTYAFGGDTRSQLQHDKLADLVTKLEGLTAGPKAGTVTLSGIEERHVFAQTLRERTVNAHAADWRDAIARVASNPKYHGLKLKEQVGLIPLGEDRDSHLEEFAETQTGAPIRRGHDGRLMPSEEMSLVFVMLPPGKFWMGAQRDDASKPNYDLQARPEETLVHEVTLDAFLLSKYEMTQGQWLRFVGRNPSSWRQEEYKEITLRSPVEQVSHEDCQRELERLGYVFPTEAQWEYACRSGTSTPFHTGETMATLQGVANIADQSGASRFSEGWNFEHDFSDGYPMVAPVGSLRANGFGLHDPHGNVAEWCSDGFGLYGDHPPGVGDGLRSLPGAPYRVVRGGSFSFLAVFARSAGRSQFEPGFRIFYLGLRPARRIDP